MACRSSSYGSRCKVYNVNLSFDNLALARLRQAVDRAADPALAGLLLSILAAAGAGPSVPLEIILPSLDTLGHSATIPQLRDLLVRFGTLVSRGQPGLPQERVGMTHVVLIDVFDSHADQVAEITGWFDVAAAHVALAITVGATLGGADKSKEAIAYASSAGPRHYLRAGDIAGAVSLLSRLDGPSAADNRDRWATWLGDILRAAGPTSESAFLSRHKLAQWQGQAGDPAGAAAAFQDLLEDRLRILGPDHPDTLSTRQNLASWRGHAGEVARAARDSMELLQDRLRVLGPEHPKTFSTRHNVAYWVGQAGDAEGAANAFAELLADQLRVLGPDHPDTLATRQNVIQWTRMTDDRRSSGSETQSS
jgi:hypothetical protein